MAPVRLRVGIFANARLQPRWMADAFANVARSGWAEVVALQASEGGASAGPWRLRIYRAMDRWAFGADLCDPVDLPAHVPYVFFTDCGRVSMLEIDAAGRWSPPRRVLERNYRLSHPFLLEHEEALYLIPEAAHAVELYRCVDFPLRWKLERVLLGGVRLADATVHRSAERWWMFANAAAGASGVCDELHLFHAQHLAGEWRPHRRNPVKCDARSSRPAGRLYWRRGALYRPAQIGAPRYGAGVSLHRVLRLSPEEYAERQVARVLPPHGMLGLHTVNRAGALTVVDFLARRGWV